MDPLVWDCLLGILIFETVVWTPLLMTCIVGLFAWRLPLGNVRSITSAWHVPLETVVWDLLLKNDRLGVFAWEPFASQLSAWSLSIRTFHMGSLAGEFPLGISCFGSGELG